jgi:tRNA G37 N-methylase TrmD
MDFVLSAIQEHKQSEQYKVARDAELYYKHQNPTIMRFQKFVHNQFGKKVPDVLVSGNHALINKWRAEQAVKITRKKRPDLYRKYKRALEKENKK